MRAHWTCGIRAVALAITVAGCGEPPTNPNRSVEERTSISVQVEVQRGDSETPGTEPERQPDSQCRTESTGTESNESPREIHAFSAELRDSDGESDLGRPAVETPPDELPETPEELARWMWRRLHEFREDNPLFDSDEPVPPLSNPVARSLIAKSAQIVGNWSGRFLSGFDYSDLAIKRLDDGTYECLFRRRTDFGNFQAKRVGKLADGILTLDKPVDAASFFDTFRALCVVRVRAQLALVPLENAEKLKQGEPFDRETGYLRGTKNFRPRAGRR